ncbi:hypothetical protein IWZ01DRAFT_560521, partial [Phyllosticta capitalensis]
GRRRRRAGGLLQKCDGSSSCKRDAFFLQWGFRISFDEVAGDQDLHTVLFFCVIERVFVVWVELAVPMTIDMSFSPCRAITCKPRRNAVLSYPNQHARLHQDDISAVPFGPRIEKVPRRSTTTSQALITVCSDFSTCNDMRGHVSSDWPLLGSFPRAMVGIRRIRNSATQWNNVKRSLHRLCFPHEEVIGSKLILIRRCFR